MALIVAALTALLAVLSLALQTAMLGVTPPSLLDAAIFGVVSWRIFKMSRAWAVTGMVIYAIRDTFAFHRLPPQDTEAAGARLLGGRL